MIRTWILSGVMLLAVAGCSRSDETESTPGPAPSSPGSAPSYGKPSGMGFSTGDAAHSSGQGSGLMGYHGTGSMGASNTTTDKHEVPPPPASTTEPVLPAP